MDTNAVQLLLELSSVGTEEGLVEERAGHNRRKSGARRNCLEYERKIGVKRRLASRRMAHS